MFKALREFFIYLKYRKIVKKEAASDVIWTRQGLRYDWLCRIYTVVNLPPQVTMSPDIPPDARGPFVFDAIKPVNDYMRRTGIEEMITVSIDPVDGTDKESYLVVYYFLFKIFNFWWFLFYFVLIPSSLVFLLIYTFLI